MSDFAKKFWRRTKKKRLCPVWKEEPLLPRLWACRMQLLLHSCLTDVEAVNVGERIKKVEIRERRERPGIS